VVVAQFPDFYMKKKAPKGTFLIVITIQIGTINYLLGVSLISSRCCWIVVHFVERGWCSA
jgi:multisubunit Na+/H+ antiporter MnhG subunit